jgi:hypothetical protein
MHFIFGYFLSMRYLLVGYVRRWICLAGRFAGQDTTQLILLELSEAKRMEG